MTEGFKVKGNRKNKFLSEFAELLVENLVNNDILVDVYEQLAEGENVKELEE